MDRAKPETGEGSSSRARQLRKQASDAENRLWYVLKNRNFDGLKFVRQLAIGPFVADFVCREHQLIIEIDGGQHAGSAGDERRTRYLRAQGYGILRFWNNEVLGNRDGVLASIRTVIAGTPSPDLRFAPATLSPTGRGTRGARAASAAQVSQISRIPATSSLSVGERVDRPQAEPDEGSSATEGTKP